MVGRMVHDLRLHLVVIILEHRNDAVLLISGRMVKGCGTYGLIELNVSLIDVLWLDAGQFTRLNWRWHEWIASRWLHIDGGECVKVGGRMNGRQR